MRALLLSLFLLHLLKIDAFTPLFDGRICRSSRTIVSFNRIVSLNLETDLIDDNDSSMRATLDWEEEQSYCNEEFCEQLFKSRSSTKTAGTFLLLDRNLHVFDRRAREKDFAFSKEPGLEILRKRYGDERNNIFGDWTNSEARAFYKQQLPKTLLEGGEELNLTLQQRAQLASEARHCLRRYSRERQNFIGRLVAKGRDGIRSMRNNGYWSTEGPTWNQLKEKYLVEAHLTLGDNKTEDDYEQYAYLKILERSCVTNQYFDEIAETGLKAVLQNKLREKFNQLRNNKRVG